MSLLVEDCLEHGRRDTTKRHSTELAALAKEKEDDGFDSIRSSYGRQTTADKRKSFSMPGEKLGEFGNNGLGPPSHNGNVRKSIIGSNRFGEATGINESAFCCGFVCFSDNFLEVGCLQPPTRIFLGNRQ